jgi:hypothetical protein
METINSYILVGKPENWYHFEDPGLDGKTVSKHTDLLQKEGLKM